MRIKVDDESGNEDAQALNEVPDDMDKSCSDVDVLPSLGFLRNCASLSLIICFNAIWFTVAVAMRGWAVRSVAVAVLGGTTVRPMAVATPTPVCVSVLVKTASHAIQIKDIKHKYIISEIFLVIFL